MSHQTAKEVTAASARLAAQALGADQSLVANRRQLAAAGVPHWVVRHELRVGRWQPWGSQVVILHNGPLSAATRRAAAVLEVSPVAALDGVSALQEAGITGLDDTLVVVSAPKGSRPRRPPDVRVRETRRFRESDVVGGAIRRMRPAVAAVHAALWAVSDRQATLFLTLTVQQRRATAATLATELATVRSHRRRAFLTQILLDLAGGAHSLGELDVGRGLRRRGLPEPVRQSVRQRPNGKEYLDCEFPEFGLVLEIDGAGHLQALQALSDLIRDLHLATEGHTVIRIPLIAWRLDEESVLDALELLFRSRGWLPRAA